jgi:hypothetical protein
MGLVKEKVISQMHPPEEFLRHAAECELMAKFARKAEDKATWNEMADRWLRCAELFAQESLAAGTNARRRQPRNAPIKRAYH